MEIQESFNVALEKMMNLDITTVFWSNIMDLIAILTKSNILEAINFIFFKYFIVFFFFRCIESATRPKKYSK